MIRVIEWDGTGVPAALRDLPPGRYVVEPLDDVAPLTAEEDAGIAAALDALDRGQGEPLDQVLTRVRSQIAP